MRLGLLHVRRSTLSSPLVSAFWGFEVEERLVQQTIMELKGTAADLPQALETPRGWMSSAMTTADATTMQYLEHELTMNERFMIIPPTLGRRGSASGRPSAGRTTPPPRGRRHHWYAA